VCSDTHVRYRHAIMSRRNAAILAVLCESWFLTVLTSHWPASRCPRSSGSSAWMIRRRRQILSIAWQGRDRGAW
jgi:hypothetical protein